MHSGRAAMTSNGKEDQEPRQHKEVFSTVWNRQPNATLHKRLGHSVQRMQSQNQKADGRIPVDAK